MHHLYKCNHSRNEPDTEGFLPTVVFPQLGSLGFSPYKFDILMAGHAKYAFLPTTVCEVVLLEHGSHRAHRECDQLSSGERLRLPDQCYRDCIIVCVDSNSTDVISCQLKAIGVRW
ncbi:uncharacterized protein BJ212DRAFT_624908 [Suillus subaureus]|uniref:Uncharacterized protein n=1 Tax=Suillus subaureus TaxID=48587 RepID=A0A9P7ARD6_9AGAM|nr:uncharacterized protein BJ212DRAFT_624908 [Suillus subaureus]KAG1794934.1 hypothetical protein BJ212DRAFT_624908 [Suillus subaureus]